MLIALAILLFSGGSKDIWLFPENFSDQVEEIVLEERRQSEILDLIKKIDESVNSHNDSMNEQADIISLLNKNPETTDIQLEEVVKNLIGKRKDVQEEILEARLKMTTLLSSEEWGKIYDVDTDAADE